MSRAETVAVQGEGGDGDGACSMADEMLIKVTWPGNTFVPAICSGIANRLWQIDGNTRQINQNIFYLSAKDIYEKRISMGYLQLSVWCGKV